MTATRLLDALRTKGVRLSGEGEQLAVDAPKGILTDDLHQAIRQHKAALLALLVQPAQANAATATAPSTEACTHQAHFPPSLTDGPLRQCVACPHCWYVACACGIASWKPTASWGADGAGVVGWTCRGCGGRYGEMSLQYTDTYPTLMA